MADLSAYGSGILTLTLDILQHSHGSGILTLTLDILQHSHGSKKQTPL
jgi:hypothetical protein